MEQIVAFMGSGALSPTLFAADFNGELIATVGGAILFAFFFLIWVLKQILIICPPNKVLVKSGRSQKGQRGYEPYFGGLVVRIPILEQVEEMELVTIPINISVHNAYSKGGIVLHVEAVANVKISSDRNVVTSAIERFLGRDTDDIKRAAQDTLEGNLREVLATLTPEEINEDRLRFANKLKLVAEEDLTKLGLHMDTLKIQHVSDNNEYLDSIGRLQLAEILRDAEIAESNAGREAANVEAEARASAQVARETTNAEIARRRNQLDQLKAELEAKAKGEEETTIAAAAEARARAEQELQSIRAQLEELRLQADKIIPAEAMKRAREMQAKGAAAPIAENGKALASALQSMSSAWADAGEEAKDIFLIQQLEKILGLVVNTVNNMEVGEVHVIDNGDGNALPNYVRAFPDTVSAILQSLQHSTGIDVSRTLSEAVKSSTTTQNKG
jgi:flotillin